MAKKPCDCDSGKMTFEQWAASGGAIPLSFKGREKAWANQVKKYAAGGSANSKGKAGDLSVLEMGDMSSPAYRAHLERKQGLEGSYPESFVAPAVRGAASAVKGFLGNLGKPKPGQLSPGHYEFANAKRDVAMSQLTKQEMDTFYRTGNLPSRFPELLENASVIGSKVGRVPMPKPEKKTLQERLVEGVMTPAGRRSAVDLGLNTANQMSDIYDQKGFAPAGGDKAGSYAAGGSVSPAAQIDGDEFVEAAKAYGLGTDNDTLNKIVARVNRGQSVREAARAVAQSQSSGEAKMQAGGAVKLFNLLKGTQEVLPAAQREANLQRLLAESKAPMRLYHGTMATEGGKNQEAIRRIKPSREGALGSGVYLTPQSEFASTYAGFPARSQLERDIKTGSDFAKKSARQLLDRMDRGAVEPHEVGGNMLPVYAQIKNPLVLEGKGDPMIEALVKLGMDKDAAGKMVESAYERKGYIGKEVESRARAAGYDGLMQYRDGNLSEVVSYNPNAIKSATGNVGTFDVTKPDLSKADGGAVHMQAGGVSKLTKSLTGAKKAEDAAKTSLGEVGSMVTKMGEEGRSPIIPVPNRWFLQPDKFPHQQKLVERVLATTGKAREDFPSGAFVDPRTGEVLDSRIMNELGVVIDPKTNRPMMTAKGESGIEVIDPRLGAFTKSNLVRKGLFKPQGGDQILNDLNFLATIEKGDVGHKYGLATEYASPAELWNTGTGANPTLRPRSRGDLFGVGDVVGQVRVGRSEPHDVYEKLFVAPKGSDVQGVKLSKAKGGEVKMAEGGDPSKPYIGYRRAGRRPESQQDREASANIPVAAARGLVSGAMGMPGDIESLVRLPYELITGKESPTILPTSEDVEKRLPLRGASQTPAGQMFTGAGQLAGGFYTGPGSGARAVTAIPKAVVKAGKDFVMAAPQGAPRMFIGPKAKTWDQAKADRAAQMEKEGKDPVDIWRETGTFRSADGILRQEISDVGAIHRNPTQLKELGKQKKEEAIELGSRLFGNPWQKDMFPKALTEAKKPVREKIKTLKEEADELMRHSDVRGQRAKFALEHPELYKAYPELGEIPVYQGGRGIGSERASIRGGPQDLEMEITQSGLRHDPRSSALHEMQHAIQTIEGMGPGGNPTMAFANPKAHEILKELRKKALEPMSFEDYAKQYSHVPDLQQGYESYKRAIPRVVKNMENELQREAAMEYYKRLAGEAEARATQAREPMSASQRAQEFPYSSYDVLPEDLIVNPAKGSSISMQMGPNDYKTVKAGDKLGDLTVGEDISNRGSIEASGIEKVLPEVRAVPMSSFEATAPHDLFYAKDDLDRVRALAEEIKQSGRIDPMIVGVDEKGNYILEGAHRLGALHLLGAKEFPALIAVEEGVKGFSSGGEVKMQDGGAAFGRYTTGKKYQGAVKRAKEADVNTLADPRTYAFVSGLLGEAPDQLGFSVMHPDYKGIQEVGEKGFMGGTILGVAPAVGPMTKGLPVGASIKPKGGNWLTGSVEKAVQPLKRYDLPDLFPELGTPPPNSAANEALNQWIDRNLTNYIKKEMATPEDPVRLLIERRQAEVEGKYIKDQERAQRMADRAAAETDPRRQANLSRQAQQMRDEADLERELGMAHLSHLPSGFGETFRLPSYIEFTRESRGFPAEGMSKTQASKIWEDLSDTEISGTKAKLLSDARKNLNPWTEKLNPEELVYGISKGSERELGFDHIVDVLKQDLAAGRISPEQLSKVSMEQAVRRTAEFDQDMAKKMREARIKITEGMPVHKEYPEGYKWIELKTPEAKLPEGYSILPDVGNYRNPGNQLFTIFDDKGNAVSTGATEKEALRLFKRQEREKTLEDALKYEGETMGHCVGGYCPDVLAGRSRIYSLRDAKGEPHVTVEVQPSKTLTPEKRAAQMESLMHRLRGEGMSEEAAIKQAEKLYPESETLSRIVQIKGKQNKAPKEEYLPFVQDFVKGSQWSEVGDLKNTGLQKVEEGSTPGFQEWMRLKALGNEPKIPAGYYKPEELLQFGSESGLKEAHPSIYKKWRENLGLPPEDGMKAGGEVKMQAGGIAKLKALLEIGQKGKEASKALIKAEKNDLRSQGLGVPGEDFADVMNPANVMRMSEALGNAGAEGKTLNLTQADRSRVFGTNKGGTGFSGLQLTSPPHQQAGTTWGVGKPSHVTRLINANTPDTIWTTFIGSPTQHMSNPVTVERMYEAHRKANPSAALIEKMNKQINGAVNLKTGKPVFSEPIDISDPASLAKAQTFDQRKVLAQAMTIGGEKKGEKATKEAFRIVREETDPLLIESPTYAVGNRLWTIDKDAGIYRPDLNAAFPYQVVGTDLGLVYNPAPVELAAPEFFGKFANRLNKSGKPQPMGHKDLTATTPKQLVNYEYLTNLQKAGYAKGGKVGGLSQAKNQRKK